MLCLRFRVDDAQNTRFSVALTGYDVLALRVRGRSELIEQIGVVESGLERLQCFDSKRHHRQLTRIVEHLCRVNAPPGTDVIPEPIR